MKTITRCLVLLAVVGQISLSAPLAYGQAAGGTGGTGGTGAGTGGNGAAGSTGGTAGGGDGGGGNGGGGNGGGHGGGPFNWGAPASASGGCDVPLQLSDPTSYRSAEEGLSAITQETETFIQQCGVTQDRVAEALQTYSKALKKVAPSLPKAFRSLPRLVAVAARRVKAAPTLRAAVKVVQTAVAVVRKTISLMRAVDPDAQAVATRGGEQVARVLDVAATTLERAGGL